MRDISEVNQAKILSIFIGSSKNYAHMVMLTTYSFPRGGREDSGIILRLQCKLTVLGILDLNVDNRFK